MSSSTTTPAALTVVPSVANLSGTDVAKIKLRTCIFNLSLNLQVSLKTISCGIDLVAIS